MGLALIKLFGSEQFLTPNVNFELCPMAAVWFILVIVNRKNHDYIIFVFY